MNRNSALKPFILNRKFNLKNVILLALIINLFSCKKDDNNVTIPPPRDRTEVQAEDKLLLIDYLDNHYYNADKFDGTNPNPSIKDLEITKLEEGETLPGTARFLIDDVITKSLNFCRNRI